MEAKQTPVLGGFKGFLTVRGLTAAGISVSVSRFGVNAELAAALPL
jgi:hypothetical protein